MAKNRPDHALYSVAVLLVAMVTLVFLSAPAPLGFAAALTAVAAILRALSVRDSSKK